MIDFSKFDALDNIRDNTFFSCIRRIYCYGCKKQYNMFPGLDDEDFKKHHEVVDADSDFIYWKCKLKYKK